MAIELSVQKRDVFGRKVKKIRERGLIPAELYGRGIENVHLAVPAKEFDLVFQEAGESAVVELKVAGGQGEEIASSTTAVGTRNDNTDGARNDNEIASVASLPRNDDTVGARNDDEPAPRNDGGTNRIPVLIYNIQRNPVSGKISAVDFYQVRLDEKVEATAPITLVGEAPAIKNKDGVLLQVMNEVEVEALPADIPRSISVDVSSLVEIDQSVHISDLKVASGVKILAEPEAVVATIQARMTEEEEKALEGAPADVSEVKVEGERPETAEKGEEPISNSPNSPNKMTNN